MVHRVWNLPVHYLDKPGMGQPPLGHAALGHHFTGCPDQWQGAFSPG